MTALQSDFESLNRQAAPNELIFRPNLRLTIHPDSRVPFEMFCWRAPEMVEEMDAFLANTQGKERLLDVGALHGVFALAFAAQGASRRAVAIDPSPMAFAKLLYNVHANKFAGRVTPVECALSDAPGTIPMFYEWEHAVAASRNPGVEVAGAVEKTTGDLLCQRLGFFPDAIKIDVEGHEVKVIRGLEATIRKAKPLLFLEIHPQRIKQEGDSLTELLDYLSLEGYQARNSSGAVRMQDLSAAAVETRVILEAIQLPDFP
jgi:FkbM family methyltransferase